MKTATIERNNLADSLINKPVTKEIKDSEGNTIIRIHGELNTERLARCLLGLPIK